MEKREKIRKLRDRKERKKEIKENLWKKDKEREGIKKWKKE